MDKKALQEIFIKILRSELTGTGISLDEIKLDDEFILSLYALSKKHDLAHVVASFLYKNKIALDNSILSKFRQEEIMSVYRYEQINHTYKEICEVLENANISYIPLKGAVLRKYYPKESMRTSCDIDILIDADSLNTAVNKLLEKGYKCGEKSYHDVALYSPSNVHLELHFHIQENIDNLDKVLKNAWHYAKNVEGSRHCFTDEFFIFYNFAHLTHHFLTGGCGVRPLMDIWIIKHKMGLDFAVAKELLESAGIYKFAQEITNLSEICFSDKEKDDFTDTLLKYIFDGGVYGSMDNDIAMNDEKIHVTFSYVMKKIFVPYSHIAIEYPSARKQPILYPFCWIHRTVKLFFKFMGRIFARKKRAKDVSGSKTTTAKQIRSRLGL